MWEIKSKAGKTDAVQVLFWAKIEVKAMIMYFFKITIPVDASLGMECGNSLVRGTRIQFPPESVPELPYTFFKPTSSGMPKGQVH